jgi:exodeoxyribonuclease VII large subunit
MADDIPTLADLRRSRSKRPAPRTPSSAPSLFDAAPDPIPDTITTADILAEQSRALRTPSSEAPPPKRSPSAQDLAEQSRALRIPSSEAPPSKRPPSAQDQVYTVGELVRRVRTLVEHTYGHITVEGEISNWRPAVSGHCYFTLKDGEAQLSIVLFRRQAALLRFRPKDGDAVRISGQLSVYESRGQMQLIAESMQQTGLGALLAAVQQLKDRLRREGLFDNARPLPAFPRCIGIVTSLQGAALRDIVKVCRRRHAAVNLLIYPSAVQGPNCPTEVAAGVRWFSERSKRSGPHSVDVVLVARGGGSWEDLHGFDDEILARTIAACSIPVITGIGHAPDSTIADSAADLCAPTPSAAAELVTAAQQGIADRVLRLRSRLERSNSYNLLRTRQHLTNLGADAILRRVRNTLERTAQHLDDLTFRAESAINRNLRTRSTRLAQLEGRLRRQHVSLRTAAANRRFDSLTQRLHSARTTPFLDAHNRLNHATSQLEALSPLRVLDRGYSLVYAPNGKLLRNSEEAPAGTTITAHLAKGRLRAKVTTSE